MNDKKYSNVNYNPKYIVMLKDKSIEEIKKHILEKLKYNSDAHGLKLEMYLFNIYRVVNVELNFKENLSVLKMISLKYCKLLFKGNDTFEIKYGFNLIEEIVKEEIKKINIQEDGISYYNKEELFLLGKKLQRNRQKKDKNSN